MTDETRALAEARAEIERLRAELAKAKGGLGREEFVRVLGHELRAPLAPMLTAVQLLEDDPALGPDAKRWVGIFRRNLWLEARLVDDMLDFLRLARGQLEPARERTSLVAVVTAAIEAAQGEAKQRNGTIEASAPGRANDVTTDPPRLQHGLWHLLRAAAKTMRAGGTLRVSSGEGEGGRAVIVIEQPEPGADPTAATRALGALSGDDHVAMALGAVGLAVLFGRALVAAAGGAVSARASATGALTIEVALAATTSPAARPAVAEARRKVRVLLVDDHEDTLDLLALVLQERGYDVVPARSVAEATRAAEKGPFDVLVSDLSLPDGSGIDLVARLRASGMSPRCIAVSGYSSPDDVARVKAGGFVELLVKPVTTETLDGAIARALR